MPRHYSPRWSTRKRGTSRQRGKRFTVKPKRHIKVASVLDKPQQTLVPRTSIKPESEVEIKEAILKVARNQEIDPRTFKELEPLYAKYGKENVMKVYHELDKESGWLGRTFGGYKTLAYKGKDFLREREVHTVPKTRKYSEKELDSLQNTT